jgi:hypothetical protein
MTEPINHYDVGRLIQWGLKRRARPSQEGEYRRLIARFIDHPDFKAAVRDVAFGMGLEILEVSETHGIYFVPATESTFGMPPGEFRRGASTTESRLLDGLILTAIGALVFPRPEDLDPTSNRVQPDIGVAEVDSVLRALCERVRIEEAGDADPLVADLKDGVRQAWRVYEGMPSGSKADGGKRGRRNTTFDRIRSVLDLMVEQGFFRKDRSGLRYQPLHSYHVRMRLATSDRVLSIVHEALNPAQTQES